MSRATLTAARAKTRLNRLWEAIALCAGRQAAYPDCDAKTRHRIAAALEGVSKGWDPRDLFAQLSAVITCPPRELLEFPTLKEPIARFIAVTRCLKLSKELGDEVYAALSGWSEHDQTLILSAVTEALRGEA